MAHLVLASQTRLHPAAAQPMRNGESYRVASPPAEAVVTPELARELSRVLELFARDRGFNREKPLDVQFGRGVLGLHRFDRAADIYGVGSRSLAEWVKRWNEATRKGRVEAEKETNLGYRLYRALQTHGRWAQPRGYPVQLFGPWTRAEGPHRAISDRLLYAHRDHIHIAK